MKVVAVVHTDYNWISACEIRDTHYVALFSVIVIVLNMSLKRAEAMIVLLDTCQQGN
jgi:hypothetical protein